MIHYFIRIRKKIQQGRNIDDKTEEMIHECVIEVKSLRAAKLKARKVLEALPIAEEMTTNYCHRNKYQWEDQYKATSCCFVYWNDQNERITIGLGISPLYDYYTLGVNACASAAHDLKEAIKHLQEEQTYLYTNKPADIDTHPKHLQAEVKEIEEELFSIYQKLDKFNEKYRHYYNSLGK